MTSGSPFLTGEKCFLARQSFLLTHFVLRLLFLPAHRAFALASNNIPLDSPLIRYPGKLAGFGIITANIQKSGFFQKQ